MNSLVIKKGERDAFQKIKRYKNNCKEGEKNLVSKI